MFTNITVDIIEIGGANLKSCVQMTNGIPKTHAKNTFTFLVCQD